MRFRRNDDVEAWQLMPEHSAVPPDAHECAWMIWGAISQ
jgi:hypothetical protein